MQAAQLVPAEDRAYVTEKTVCALIKGQHRSAKAKRLGLGREPTSASQTASTTKPGTGNTYVMSANANLTRKGIVEIDNARSRDLSNAAVEQGLNSSADVLFPIIKLNQAMCVVIY